MFDFSRCDSPEAIKTLYRQLARQHHPDFGGELEKMQQLNADFAQALANFSKRAARTRQDTAHAKHETTQADYCDLDDIAEQIRAVIQEVMNQCHPGIELEITGLWLWASGNTRENKDTLKAIGFKWAPTKKLWYFPFVPSRNRRKKYSMDDIRAAYGSQKVNTTHADAPRMVTA